MRRIVIGIAASVALIAGCGDAFRERVQERVKDQLIDPESAQFSIDWYDEARDLACGAVNARNRFGGYAGRSLWAYKNGRAYLGNAEGSMRVWGECDRARYPDQFPSNTMNASNVAMPQGNQM